MQDESLILLVDDDPQFAAVIKEFLEGEGHAVAVAATGGDGIAALRAGGVALLLLDLVLPDMAGVEVLRETLALPDPPEAIVVTAHGALDSAVLAAEIGSAGYMLKPVDLLRLGAAVRRVLERRRLLQHNARLSAGLALLHEVSRALHASLELERVVPRALDELGRAFGVDAAVVSVLDEQGAPARTLGRLLSEGHARDLRFRATGGIGQIVRESRAPVVLPDIAARPDVVHPAHFAHGVRSLAAFPVRGRDGTVLAVLFLYYRAPQAFPPDLVRLLGAFADQLAAAFENARLYEAARTQERRLEQILDSTSDGVVVLGPGGRVIRVNRRAGELLALAPERVVGAWLGDLLVPHFPDPAACEGAAAPLGAALDDPTRPTEGELALPLAGRVLHWTAQPTLDPGGRLAGFTLTLQDVTREREISRMKSDFVSFVTHQLRTPLAGIRWMLELARGEPDLPPAAASYLEDGAASTERLIGLVNDLLDVSRLERDIVPVTLGPVDLAALTRDVLADLAPLVAERGHRVTVAGARARPVARGDAQLLRQVLLNLLGNAVKYTPSGGRIRVGMGRDGGRVRWQVQDSGIGIPAAAQSRLFEKFFRADNVAALETEGTGLGLYLVRLIMDRLDGQVWCRSREGRGATFGLTLPAGGGAAP